MRYSQPNPKSQRRIRKHRALKPLCAFFLLCSPAFAPAFQSLKPSGFNPALEEYFINPLKLKPFIESQKLLNKTDKEKSQALNKATAFRSKKLLAFAPENPLYSSSFELSAWGLRNLSYFAKQMRKASLNKFARRQAGRKTLRSNRKAFKFLSHFSSVIQMLAVSNKTSINIERKKRGFTTNQRERKARRESKVQKKSLSSAKKARRGLAQTKKQAKKISHKAVEKRRLASKKTSPAQSERKKALNKRAGAKGLIFAGKTQSASLKAERKKSAAPRTGAKSKGSENRLKAEALKKNRKRKAKVKDKSLGWKIPYIKSAGIFQKMKLKKGDIILEIEGRPIRSQKTLRQRLSLIIKTQKAFSLTVARGGKSFVISYKVIAFKRKKRLKVAAVRARSSEIPAENASQKAPGAKMPPRQAQQKAGKKKPAKKSSKKPPTPQALVPEKYKNQLQLAFISSLNSFVYEEPNFDSQQLFPLETGKKVLISKKIFRPAHKFGSFYKLFLVKPKKIVGYVSEAELIPEFLKSEKGGSSPNPAFKEALLQIKRDGVLDINLKDEIKKKSAPQEEPKSSSSSGKKVYAGAGLGIFGFDTVSEKNILIGLKLSGYRLLVSSWNMDINVLTAPFDFKFFYLDASIAYPLASSAFYHLFATGGLKFAVNYREENPQQQISPGPVAGLSLLIPFNPKTMLRVDLKAKYSLGGSANGLGGGALGALQTVF